MTQDNDDDQDSEEEVQRLLRQRKQQKTRYNRQDASKKPGINGDTWRRPRGTHSSLRLQTKGQPPVPGVGRRSPKQVRGLHPSGREEIHVTNKTELDDALAQADDEPVAIRLSSRLSLRKKKQFIEHAHEQDVPVLNIPQKLKPSFTQQQEDDGT